MNLPSSFLATRRVFLENPQSEPKSQIALSTVEKLAVDLAELENPLARLFEGFPVLSRGA